MIKISFFKNSWFLGLNPKGITFSSVLVSTLGFMYSVVMYLLSLNDAQFSSIRYGKQMFLNIATSKHV